ncbi:MAG: GerAB/ArcD/ProY family transporter [Eubacteriaceae bacterium]
MFFCLSFVVSVLVIKGVETVSIISFPFAETVLFMGVFSVLPNIKSYKKVYIKGLLIGDFFILIITIRNIIVLGVDVVSILYFPSYIAVSMINIGDFLQRIEIVVSLIFIFAGFVKVSICLLVASKGVSKILNLDNYRVIVSPLGLMMINLAYLIYDDIIEMQNWAFKVYKYYALPIQVILPIIILFTSWLKIKKTNLLKNIK